MVRMLLATSVLAATATAYADDTPPPTIETAIQQAAAADKPLLVEFSAQWCGPCREFEKTTLAEPDVQRALTGVTFVHYDAEAAPGDAAAERYGVHAYPTFLVIDKQGVARERREGAMLGASGAQAFVALIAAMPSAVEDEAAVLARLKAHPKDAMAHQAAARWYVAHSRPLDAVPHYNAVANDASVAAAMRADAASVSARLQRQARWKHDLVTEKLALVRAAPKAVKLDDLAIATIGSELTDKELRAVFASVLAASQDDVDRVNGIVYIALTAGAKDEALAAAKKMIEKQADAQHLDTLAECYHVTGNQAEALRVEDQAIAMAHSSPLSPELASNRARFASGSGTSSEVTQLEAKARDLWDRLDKADQLADRVRTPDDARRKQMQQYTQQWHAIEKLEEATGKACKAEAGAAKEAYARVTIDAQGKITSTVLLLEPGATKKLRDCLTTQLVGSELPVITGQPPERTLSIHFTL